MLFRKKAKTKDKTDGEIQVPEYNEGYIRGKVGSVKYYKKKPRREGTDRLPPGQQLIGARFPVLDLGFKPNFDPKKWKLKIHGLVEYPQEFTYDQFSKLPKTTVSADFHCVTHGASLMWSGAACALLICSIL